MPVIEESCSHRCGYVSQGRDLIEHELYEHAPCPDCGMGADQDAGMLGAVVAIEWALHQLGGTSEQAD